MDPVTALTAVLVSALLIGVFAFWVYRIRPKAEKSPFLVGKCREQLARIITASASK